jgi:CRISPR-associated autoregulator DevR family
MRNLTHVTGTFVIDGFPCAINNAGISKSVEDRNYTLVKMFQDGVRNDGRAYRTVFVSAQSWRRMWRDSLIEETGWPESQMRALKLNADGNTDKVGTERDPVSYVEDDAFGYMVTSKGSGKLKVTEEVTEENGEEGEKEEGGRVKTVSRTSPLSTSILVGLKKDGWEGKMESYVSLTEGNSLPYKTQFANTGFEGMFSLNFSRLCKFSNIGDRIELDEELREKYLENKMIVEKGEQEYFGIQQTEEEVWQNL